jgi:hypothetical protein
MEFEQAFEAALEWHPEWQDRYWDNRLNEEDNRHLLFHATVEGMLAANENFASIAEQAERRGLDGHEIRHSLARAFLFVSWYHALEGTGYDPVVMAQRFVLELQKVRRSN